MWAGGARLQTDDIEAVGIADDGSVYVKPATVELPYIWREAAEVHWDQDHKRLYGPVPRKWTQLGWFKHIITIAMHHGTLLSPTDLTKWINVSGELRGKMIDFDPTVYLSSTNLP